MRRQELGLRGELLAYQYLTTNGYQVLEKNYRQGHLEVDIIAKIKKNIVFFEVKTVSQSIFDNNDIPIKARQIKRLKRAMLLYSGRNKISLESLRLDLILISFNPFNFRAKLRHWRDILN